MDINNIIKLAKSQNRSSLSEAESKQILASYGIPVVKECIAYSPDAALKAADEFGYPVVVKGLGSKLMHKTERGLVCLNLKNREDVLAAARAIEMLPEMILKAIS